MHRSPEPVDIDRRALLRLGLARASALGLGSGQRVGAGETTGIERKVLKEVDSTIPGYAKIRVRDISVAFPFDRVPEDMPHPRGIGAERWHDPERKRLGKKV
ncbi:MAG: hypothetical protein ACRERE_26830 [Candidatus Entotheonellia bacterium]